MKKIFLAIISIVLLGTACDNIDFGDTNKNVNGPKDISTGPLLSGAITNFGDDRGRPYRMTPTLNVQYLIQIVYNDEMLYADYSGNWNAYYVQELSNVQEVINICKDPASASNLSVTKFGAVENQLAVAMIWKSVIYKRVTDLFGNVPYTEALNPDILTPKYDSQEAIYKGMIADVKAARDMIDVSVASATGDVIYGGKMAKWQKFANSFLVTLGMQLTKVNMELAKSTVTEALTNSYGVLELVADDAIYTYDVPNGFTNPWSWLRPADYGVSAEFISALKGKGFTSNKTYDDRIKYVTRDLTRDGYPYGLESYTGSNARIKQVVYAAATKLPILTSAYTYLHRAEAAARGWTTENVGDMLTSGIMNSFQRGNLLYFDLNGNGYEEAGEGFINGTTYAAARVADISTAGALKVIGEEKWVALFPQGFEAWAEWRRTDYPKLTPAADALNDGKIPRRYNYPSGEPSLNPAGYNSGKAALSPATDNNTSRMWWDK